MNGGAAGAMRIEAWHGTRRRFDVFDPDRSETEYGCFFADTPEAAALYANGTDGRIVHVVLSFSNPFRCTAAEWLSGGCPDPRDVAAAGRHDGYVVDGLDGTTLIAWREASVEILGNGYLHGTDGFVSLIRRAADLGYVEIDEVEEAAREIAAPSFRP